MDIYKNIIAGIFGVVVGDALGVPVEFTSRAERKVDPVTNMREYGTHNQPGGTWSDDSSMMLATLDSIVTNGCIRYEDIMEKFRMWLLRGDYTPYGVVFDVGITCSSAVANFRSGADPAMCGLDGERDNGNGSLMRIMPVSLYEALCEEYWNDVVIDDAASTIHAVSALTHRHPRSQMACMIYSSICHELIYRNDRPAMEVVESAVNKTLAFYSKAGERHPWYSDSFRREIEADSYGRLRNLRAFKDLPDSEIQSSGYVVHTLEAAIWCLLNTGSFEECVLKAVNLGDDTDTVGAVAGGLAGLCYGYDSIPQEWLDVIRKRDWIGGLCDAFSGIMS